MYYICMRLGLRSRTDRRSRREYGGTWTWKWVRLCWPAGAGSYQRSYVLVAVAELSLENNKKLDDYTSVDQRSNIRNLDYTSLQVALGANMEAHAHRCVYTGQQGAGAISVIACSSLSRN